MYLLADSDEERVERLKHTLDALGDSLLVVGARTWNVHVHVDGAGAALEAGVEAGRLSRQGDALRRAAPATACE